MRSEEGRDYSKVRMLVDDAGVMRLIGIVKGKYGIPSS